jgi:hypothetical protein
MPKAFGTGGHEWARILRTTTDSTDNTDGLGSARAVAASSATGRIRRGELCRGVPGDDSPRTATERRIYNCLACWSQLAQSLLAVASVRG